MEILDGRQRSQELTELYTQAVEKLKKVSVTPKLVVITVGEDPASFVYVRQKKRRAEAVGMDFEWVTLGDETSQEELEATIDKFNDDSKTSGIIVQFPLPNHLSESRAMDRIAIEKDVDGFHYYNAGLLVAGKAEFKPCTPKGILNLLEAHDIDVAGMDAVVIGRSQIVGMPIAIDLIHHNATVTVCHSRTKDLKFHTQRADLIVVAIGNAHMLDASYIKEGTILIDVGINRLDDGKLVGDVDYEDVKDKVKAITPVPGGVGPMTVAMLMEQTILAAIRQHGLDSREFLG